MPLLKTAEIKTALLAVPGWERRGQAIRRTFEFGDFATAMKFVNRVAKLAEQSWHHPDIDLRWNRVTLALSTHSEGGLTEKDFALAAQCNRAAARRS